MKILKITSFYSQYFTQFYLRWSHLRIASFQEQLEKLNFDGFGWGNAWTPPLQSLGYEVLELTGNAEFLQKAWARENGLLVDDAQWKFRILEAQIKAFQPNVLFMDDYTTYSRDWIRSVRERNRSIQLVIGWCGARFHDWKVFSAYDAVLSCIPELSEEFENRGMKSFHINHAFDRRILDRVGAVSLSDRISFVGQVDTGRGDHRGREELLKAVCKEMPIEIYSSLFDRTSVEFVKDALKSIVGGTLRLIDRSNLLPESISASPLFTRMSRPTRFPNPVFIGLAKRSLRPPVFGLDMYRVLKGAFATLNNHIDVSPRSASNMRLFEATGVGACLVTDEKENLGDLFDREREVVSYRSASEAVSKLQWLMQNPKSRDEVALAGQKRCIKDHTFERRAEVLDAIISGLIHKKQKKFASDAVRRP